jgi:hypothetical protein
MLIGLLNDRSLYDLASNETAHVGNIHYDHVLYLNGLMGFNQSCGMMFCTGTETIKPYYPIEV